MEKNLDVQEVLKSIREDDHQLEKLISDLKRREEPSADTICDTPLPFGYQTTHG
jgi:hypothetical protein